MKKHCKNIPILDSIARKIISKKVNTQKPFTVSKKFWLERYNSGGNSGDGSYGLLAQFKADILNDFIRNEKIKTIIEYGCGDGNQLKLAKYPYYIGFEISSKAITLCRKIFANDSSKTFKLMDEYNGEKAQLTLSLDVIYHLIEDNVFHEYMDLLFDSAEKYVIIYSSNTNKNLIDQASHVKHRKFSAYVEKSKFEWKLCRYIPNKYPYHGNTKNGSIADFFIYEKV